MGLDVAVVNNNPCSVYLSVRVCVCVRVCACRSMRIQLSLNLFSRARDRELSQMRNRKRRLAPVTAIMAAELKTNLFQQQVRGEKKKVIFLNYCLLAVLTFLNLSFESLAEFEAQCCCIRLIPFSLAFAVTSETVTSPAQEREPGGEKQKYHGQEAPQ